ncbi:MAG: NAD(P)H-dependent oxidoreductase [Flavobacteriaceae bacterium]|nr:NAD(P)H-dependent oxidoreductase [Flavobacteriaceae bacterium]
MKKVLAFAGSTSSSSINKKLAKYTAENLQSSEFNLIDLRDYNVPIYSIDEEQKGIPEDVHKFTNLLDNYHGFIVSLAEHNGSFAAAYKNLFDWTSRINKKVFRDKPLLLTATSPGGRGGANVLNSALSYYPYMGAKEIFSFSLPNFNDNFKENTLVNKDYNNDLLEKIKHFENAL